MIENTEAAKIFYITLLEASHDLSDAMVQIWDYLDDDERVRCRIAVARMVSEIYCNGIAEIERLHSGFSKTEHAPHGAHISTGTSPGSRKTVPLLTRKARPSTIAAANQCGRCANCVRAQSVAFEASPFASEQRPEITPRA